MSIKYVFSSIHIFLLVSLLMYPFIVVKNYTLDKFYVLLFLLGKLSWIFCKDECYISYIFKKLETPHYVLGNNAKEMDDLLQISPNNYIGRFLSHGVLVFPLVYAAEIVIVNNRSKIIPNFSLGIIIVFYIFYLYYIRFIKNRNLIGNSWILFFKSIYSFILFFVIYKYFVLV
jgi:hypothetical protein